MGENKIAFRINNQDIPGWCWGRVLKVCHNDRLEAGRVFYRARRADKIVKWIMSGIKSGYALRPCTDEYENGGVVRGWIDQYIFRMANKAPSMDVAAMINALTEKMTMVSA
jgi:hypothetical protein